jgi:hypothetical protein
VGYNTRHPGRAVPVIESKGQSVKARMVLLAVVLGAVLFALVSADGIWPGVG